MPWGWCLLDPSPKYPPSEQPICMNFHLDSIMDGCYWYLLWQVKRKKTCFEKTVSRKKIKNFILVAYGVVCPLITPFGLFYLVMKHGVDRYNLYYAYKRSKINKNIHATGNFEVHKKRKLIKSRPRKLVKMNDIFSFFSYSCKLRHCQSSYPTINFVVF